MGTPIPAPIAAACDVVRGTEPVAEEVDIATTEAATEEVGNEIVADVGFGVDTEGDRDDESSLLPVDMEDDRDDEDLVLAKDNDPAAAETDVAFMTVTVE